MSIKQYPLNNKVVLKKLTWWVLALPDFGVWQLFKLFQKHKKFAIFGPKFQNKQEVCTTYWHLDFAILGK